MRRWSGLLTGAVVALSIWIFDIENPNVTAPLALGIGAVVSIISILSAYWLYRSYGAQGAHRSYRRFPALRRRKSEVIAQREADESEVTDIERDVEEP
jgi:hypothetical protein